MKNAIIFAEQADTLYNSVGVVANMEKKEWDKFHERNGANYLLTTTFDNTQDNFTNCHHYYAINGTIIHVAVKVQHSGETQT